MTDLVPGDVVELQLGDIVPADIRLLERHRPGVRRVGAHRRVAAGREGTRPRSRRDAAGRADRLRADGHGRARRQRAAASWSPPAPRTEFGTIAAGLGTHQLDTEFQVGLRRFSMLLVYVAGRPDHVDLRRSTWLLHKPILDALLFSLAIAVGITPQLLPAVVSTSLAAGSRRMSRRKVLVKRLVCIEDLGDVDTLFTDKTGTLTLGRIDFMRAVPAGTADSGRRAALGAAVHRERWRRRARRSAATRSTRRCGTHPPPPTQRRRARRRTPASAVLPFDHERRMVSVLVRDGDGRQLTLVTKGAPESVLQRCVDVPAAARAALGRRVRRRQPGRRGRHPAGHRRAAADRRATSTGCIWSASWSSSTRPSRTPPQALRRLAGLGITVKVVTGDNPPSPRKVCRDLGLARRRRAHRHRPRRARRRRSSPHAIAATTVFARVSPEHKARIVRVQRRTRRRRGVPRRRRQRRPGPARRRRRASPSTPPPTSPRTPPT